jgi:hypothetical protein
MKKDGIVTIGNSTTKGVNICEVWRKNDNSIDQSRQNILSGEKI